MPYIADITQLIEVAEGLLASAIALTLMVAMALGALTLLVRQFTAFRRTVRRERIARRVEGWGAPDADDAAELRRAERDGRARIVRQANAGADRDV